MVRYTITMTDGSSYRVQGKDEDSAKLKALKLWRAKTSAFKHDAVARSTGARVQIIDTLHPDSPTEPYDGGNENRDGRYQVSCHTHAQYVMIDTLADAKWYAAHPEADGFCTGCRDQLDGNA